MMLRHLVLWSYKDGFSAEENRENAKKVKQELENLKLIIPEIVELSVHTNVLPSSNRDIMLDSLFENEAALAAYQGHPEHRKVGALIASVLQNRVCMDYYVD